jgi:hypothetical protein
MARTRDLRPEFFKNEGLAELPPLARLLFAGLWCFADREGRLEDRPKKLKIEILPYDDCDISALLIFLENHSQQFIVRYSVENRNFIWIPNFKKHQSPHPKEAPSVLPEYQYIEGDIQSRGSQVASNPIPSIASSPSFPSCTPTPIGGDVGFLENFWPSYPKREGVKVGKAECRSYWKSHNLDTKLQEILNGLSVWKMKDQWTRDNGRYVPDPIRFLRRKMWSAEITPTPASGNGVDRVEIIRQAWKQGDSLHHAIEGKHHPENLIPVDAGSLEVDISKAWGLRPRGQNACRLTEWRVSSD